jgi:hypothetical protein
VLIPAGFAQINVIHTGAQVPTGAQWTLGIDLQGNSGDPEQVAKDFEVVLLNSGIYNHVCADCDVTSVLVKFGPNDTGPSFLEAANEPGQATSGGAPQASYLIHKATAIGGRAGRGRFFLPGVPEGNIQPGGVLTSGVATALNATLVDFHFDLTAANMAPVLLHSPESPLSGAEQITGFSCDSRIATQRRRNRR